MFFLKSWRIAAAVNTILASIALLLAAALYVSAQNDSHERAVAIRKAALESCIKVNDPVRVALIQLIQDQINQSKHLPHSFFPSIPAKQFHELVKTQNRSRSQVVKKLRNVPSCETRYPPVK